MINKLFVCVYGFKILVSFGLMKSKSKPYMSINKYEIYIYMYGSIIMGYKSTPSQNKVNSVSVHT